MSGLANYDSPNGPYGPVGAVNQNRHHFFIMEQIIFGKRYQLSSFASTTCDGSASTDEVESLTTLQYVFKPSSIDPSKPGSLSISDTGEVLVDLPTLEEKAQTERFKGIATKPSNEFVLSFDGNSFKIAKVVSSVTNIRHCRNETTFSIKETVVSTAQKVRTQKLLMRAGPRVVRQKAATKPGGVKVPRKEKAAATAVDASQLHSSVMPGTESASSIANKDA